MRFNLIYWWFEVFPSFDHIITYCEGIKVRSKEARLESKKYGLKSKGRDKIERKKQLHVLDSVWRVSINCLLSVPMTTDYDGKTKLISRRILKKV